LQWGFENSLHKIQESFVEFLDNLPFRPAAWLLRLIVFPFGRSFASPNDKLDKRIAGILMEPSPIRDLLTAGIFISTDSSDPLGRLEDALTKVSEAEAVEHRLREAVKGARLKGRAEDALLEAGIRAGIINDAEADRVRLAISARKEVIQVDDFSRL
jgi:acyl-CoA dehydrogenase